MILIHVGLARVGVELLDLKVDLLGDMADVLRNNKFGHHLDEHEEESSHANNDQTEKVRADSRNLRKFSFEAIPHAFTPIVMF